VIPNILAFVSLAFAVVVLPIWIYLGVLTLFSVRRRSGGGQAPALRMVCIVPAHNEAAHIARTVKSLLDAEFPAEMKRVVVVADNCTDDTAAHARAAGAIVLERHDTDKRGKGYALETAFHHVLSEEWAEGILVVDADSTVSENFWRAMSARLHEGAPAVQAGYYVSNAKAGWRPMLMAIAFAMINGVRSLGRERLGLSTGLRGTGMGFARRTLEKVPHHAYGLAEDVEYGVRLGLEGMRVAYVPECFTRSPMPTSGSASFSQRRRWECGRQRARALVPRLLKKPSPITLDLALDLLVPPISYPALIIGLGVVVEGLHLAVTGDLSRFAPLWAICVACAAAYALRGIVFSGTGVRGVFALAFAPAYMVWKILIVRPWQKRADEWIRTRRDV
jgi:1,2-diacylglycerol 3-beta-glucosyltransferase